MSMVAAGLDVAAAHVDVMAERVCVLAGTVMGGLEVGAGGMGVVDVVS